MRGKGVEKSAENLQYGITPAYAGKRSALRAVSKVSEDHPRLCGEKLGQGSILFLLLGSPPPMRGKVALT